MVNQVERALRPLVALVLVVRPEYELSHLVNIASSGGPYVPGFITESFHELLTDKASESREAVRRLLEKIKDRELSVAGSSFRPDLRVLVVEERAEPLLAPCPAIFGADVGRRYLGKAEALRRTTTGRLPIKVSSLGVIEHGEAGQATSCLGDRIVRRASHAPNVRPGILQMLAKPGVE